MPSPAAERTPVTDAEARARASLAALDAATAASQDARRGYDQQPDSVREHARTATRHADDAWIIAKAARDHDTEAEANYCHGNAETAQYAADEAWSHHRWIISL